PQQPKRCADPGRNPRRPPKTGAGLRPKSTPRRPSAAFFDPQRGRPDADLGRRSATKTPGRLPAEVLRQPKTLPASPPATKVAAPVLASRGSPLRDRRRRALRPTQ